MILDYVLVFALAAIVAVGELFARYRDDPVDSLRSTAAMAYVAFNGLIGVAALYVLDQVAPDLLTVEGCVGGDCPAANPYRILAAAFGSLIIMRSAFARMSIGGEEVGLGPSALIEIFQRTADRGVDRMRASRRIHELPARLKDIPHDFASTTLAALCMELMQNLSAEEKQRMSERIKLVTEVSEQPEVRPLLVALILQQFVGKEVLNRAVDKVVDDYADLLERMKTDRAQKAATINPAMFGGGPPPEATAGRS